MKQLLFDFYFKYWKKYGWFGNYKTWEAAQSDCEGYDTEGILQKVVEAARKVKDGKAAFERDSVLFFEKEENTFIVQALKKAKNTEGVVRVLDFGGSLGSTYFQNRSFITNLEKWCVIEQPHFVALGKKEFTDNILSFELDIKTGFDKVKPHIILINSVLQYINDPYSIISDIEKLPVSYLLIERTPVSDVPKDKITKQIVPEYIYAASYPSWIFSNNNFEKRLLQNWDIVDNKNEKYGLHHAGGKPIFLKDILLKRK